MWGHRRGGGPQTDKIPATKSLYTSIFLDNDISLILLCRAVLQTLSKVFSLPGKKSHPTVKLGFKLFNIQPKYYYLLSAYPRMKMCVNTKREFLKASIEEEAQKRKNYGSRDLMTKNFTIFFLSQGLHEGLL